MRIVIDCRESGTSTGRYVDNLIKYLQEIDHENTYVLLYKPERINTITLQADNFTKIETPYKEFSFGEQFGFARQIRNLQPDLVHFPLVHHPIAYRNPTVIGMLDLTTLRFYNPSKNRIVFKFKQKIYWLVNYIATRKAKRIITISNFVKNDVIKTFGAEVSKFVTTYNAADLIQDKVEVIKELQGKQFITYVGRHQPHKNLNRLIDAHQILLDTYPNLVLAIAGKTDEVTEKLKESIPDIQKKRVVFTGFISDGQLRWLYENCAAYVFPSLSEGFGLPGLEAMKHGAPVVSSNATCLPEIYGDAALYFNPLDSNDIADKILNVLSDKSVGDNLRNKGYKKASEYSWKRMAEQTLEVYRSALSD